jgi:hypothetical protein
MAELTADDVADFTDGRLDSGDDEVVRMLAAALSVARQKAGWHVSPVKTETITIDGPDSRVLFLPTMKLNTLTSVEEDGVAARPVDDRQVSAGDGPLMRRRVALRKRSGGWWTGEYGGIEITMNHGFTEAEAVDWRQAILSMVDQMSLLPVSAATGGGSIQSSLRVDDVQIGFVNPYTSMAEEIVYSYYHILCNYELARVELM